MPKAMDAQRVNPVGKSSPVTPHTCPGKPAVRDSACVSCPLPVHTHSSYSGLHLPWRVGEKTFSSKK